MMRLLMVLLLISSVQADWWDSFTDTVAEGFVNIAKWVKEKASPTIREKFDSAKATLQDPETHKSIREWISEKAEKASEFANQEIIPELQKIYKAATADDGKSTTPRSVELPDD
ncbi:hypothetical protein NECAME_14705 [Necator americanus]|uniref:SXP/RAL-2 family protein Ani s 5-like cation-binding domain-containing protein n=1 Tax=Necator americanus TaxID=51031 RepID=W2SNT2_NECAM|nr:hypothetical protein NECAME_14705 [Necator americanus]ETN70531.1 hypothetical protein NECAME_14705 [Necator americanus]